MSNAQTLEDLRYCVDNFTSHKTEVENNLREFAAHLIGAGISPPAQKPASVPGGSGAALVGTPVITPFHVVGPVRPIRRVAAFEHPLQFDLVRDEFRFGYDAFEPLDAPHYVCTGSARCIGPGDWLLDDGRLGRRG